MKRCTWLAIQICRMFKCVFRCVCEWWKYIFYHWIDTNWMTAYIKKSVQFHISHGKKMKMSFMLNYIEASLSIFRSFFFIFVCRKKNHRHFTIFFFYLLSLVTWPLVRSFVPRTQCHTITYKQHTKLSSIVQIFFFFSFNIFISFDYFCRGRVKVLNASVIE